MVREDKLSAVLSEFARTMATDFPIQGILDHLVGRIVEVLPITAAGVTLISAGVAPRYIAASEEFALHMERLQTEIREGPCLSAYDSGKTVAMAELATDARFPRFGPAAFEAGLGAVFTFPLHHGDGRLGALDLYRDSPGRLDPHDMEVAQGPGTNAGTNLVTNPGAARLTSARKLAVEVPGARQAVERSLAGVRRAG